MCRTPTLAAAAAMARRLPDPGAANHEQDDIFHLLTEDRRIAEETVRQAFEIRRKKDMSHYGGMEVEVLTYRKMLKLGGCANENNAFSRESFLRQGGITGKMVFVLRAYLEDRESPSDRSFHAIVDNFRCDGDDPGTEPTEGYDRARAGRVVFVIYGRNCRLPELLRSCLTTVEYPPLKPEDYRAILAENYEGLYLRRLGRKPPEPMRCTQEGLLWYANHMGRLSETQVRRIIGETGELMADYRGEAKGSWTHRDRADFFMDPDIQAAIEERICQYKNKVLKENGNLSVLESRVDDVEGIQNLVDWFDEHKAAMRRMKDAPSGIVLVGPPGTGKSHAAKLAAQKFGLSLVQLEMDRILGGLVGDSEKNMRAMLEDLRFAAPCVLWIDELEKVLSGAESGGKSHDGTGVMKRLMGMLLSFMQENDTTVFIAATANDISGFPPEFFRTCRFDEVFSVMLPDYRGCVAIMRGKLDKRLARGEAHYSDEDAAAVLDRFIGTPARPRFITGSDIETYAKEISARWEGDQPPAREEILELIGRARLPSRVRALAPSDAPDAMEQLARRYLDLISRNFTVVGGVTAFTSENMDLDPVCFFRDDESVDELPFCFAYRFEGDGPDAGDGRRLLARRCASKDPAVWYDATFFRELNRAMTGVVIRDEHLTPPETRHEHWLFQTRMRSRQST